MNHLAKPAPLTEPAFAEKASKVEVTKCKPPALVEQVFVERVASVEPAELFDVKKHAHTPLGKRSETGISVKELRGSNGADFESIVAVLRGAPKKMFLKKVLPYFFDERDFISFGEVKRFVVIKGGSCFVYLEDTDLRPLYAFELSEVKPVMEDSRMPDKCSVTVSPISATSKKTNLTTVLLKNLDGTHAYQFTFDVTHDPYLAKRFFDAVTESSKSRQATASSIRTEEAGKGQSIRH